LASEPVHSLPLLGIEPWLSSPNPDNNTDSYSSSYPTLFNGSDKK